MRLCASTASSVRGHRQFLPGRLTGVYGDGGANKLPGYYDRGGLLVCLNIRRCNEIGPSALLGFPIVRQMQGHLSLGQGRQS